MSCAFTNCSYAKATVYIYECRRAFRKDAYELKAIVRKMHYALCSLSLCISRFRHPLTSNALSEGSASLNLSLLPKDVL